MPVAKLQAFFAIVILALVGGLHIYAAIDHSYTVPSILDDVLLIVAGALFAPAVVGKLKDK